MHWRDGEHTRVGDICNTFDRILDDLGKAMGEMVNVGHKAGFSHGV